jgi:hypothetical protein
MLLLLLATLCSPFCRRCNCAQLAVCVAAALRCREQVALTSRLAAHVSRRAAMQIFEHGIVLHRHWSTPVFIIVRPALA